MPSLVEKIDKELRWRLQRRREATIEIKRLSAQVVHQTSEIDRLLAARFEATTGVPESIPQTA